MSILIVAVDVGVSNMPEYATRLRRLPIFDYTPFQAFGRTFEFRDPRHGYLGSSWFSNLLWHDHPRFFFENVANSSLLRRHFTELGEL